MKEEDPSPTLIYQNPNVNKFTKRPKRLMKLYITLFIAETFKITD